MKKTYCKYWNWYADQSNSPPRHSVVLIRILNRVVITEKSALEWPNVTKFKHNSR